MNLITEIGSLKSELKEIKKQLLISLVTEGVDDPGILKCVFMAGGPGSGKSYTAMEVFGVDKTFQNSFAASGLKVINSDTAFEHGLKKHGISPKDLSRIADEDPELWDLIQKGDKSIRGKAKALTNKQKQFYEQGRLGMIIDGTGRRYSKIEKQRDHAMSLGYDTFMVFVNTSLEVALERNRNRERELKEADVAKMWKDVQENLGKFQTLFGSRNFAIIDNTKYGPPPREVQKAINHFVRQPIQNHIGKKWISTARALKNANLIKK